MEEAVDTTKLIPPEIMMVILSYLPVKSLLRYRSVSKEWKSIIDDPAFASLHLSRNADIYLESDFIVLDQNLEVFGQEPPCRAQWFRPDSSAPIKTAFEIGFPETPLHLDYYSPDLTVVGDVKGLLLVQWFKGKLIQGDLFLCNPSIGKSLNIPIPPSLPKVPKLCLGFDPSMNDFKVVSLSPHVNGHMLDIFSLNSRSWKRVSCSGGGGDVCRLTRIVTRRVSFGSSVQWIDGDKRSKFSLVSFDMSSETFSYTSLPNIDYENIEQLDVVAGLLAGFLTCTERVIDVWVSEWDDWSKRYTIDISNLSGLNLSPSHDLFYMRKDGVFIWRFSELDYILCVYDTNTAGGRNDVREDDSCFCPFYIGPYMESFVLLS